MNYHNNSQTIPYTPLPIQYQPPAQVIRRPPPLIRPPIGVVASQSAPKIEKPLPVFSKERSWEQHPEEPTAHYAKFKCFLAMPKEQRSIQAAYKDETGRKGTASRLWREAASKWKWPERAAAYDLHRAERYLAKAENAQDRFKTAFQETAALFAEAFRDTVAIAIQIKSQAEFTEDIKVQLSILKTISDNEPLELMNKIYKTLFGDRQNSDATLVKREMQVIFTD